jgi:hypothetical protein
MNRVQDGISTPENHETSLTELIAPSQAMPELLLTSQSSRSTSRRPSAFLTVDHSELNSHTYIYDSTKSLNQLTVSGSI